MSALNYRVGALEIRISNFYYSSLIQMVIRDHHALDLGPFQTVSFLLLKTRKTSFVLYDLNKKEWCTTKN